MDGYVATDVEYERYEECFFRSPGSVVRADFC